MSDEFKKFLNIFRGTEKETDVKTTTAIEITQNQNTKLRIHKKDFYSLRKIFLWGFDDENNPSFLVLYGFHKFKDNNNSIEGNELEENVDYTSYSIFRGKDGHLPSFESVRIDEQRDYSTGKHSEHMYYKKDLRNRSYWSRQEDLKEVEGFKFLKDKKISIPYFEDISYEEYLNIINESKIDFKNFRLAKNPNEVLKLEDKFLNYSNAILNLCSNQNLYMRKKYLKELIFSNPPKEIYDFILKIGSNELISGLFMELAFEANNTLLDEAKRLINSEISWVEGNYLNGLKRCITLYIDCFDDKVKSDKINFIKENFNDMDLKIVKIYNKELPKEKVLEGIDYMKYCSGGCFSETSYFYDSKQRKYIKQRNDDVYEKNYYSDGLVLNINNFKSTIQQCEAFGIHEVLAKIAYYLDAPRLFYYFKGSGNSKTLAYFRKYVRRIFDSYAISDELKFIEAMKILFTSYTSLDYCSFKDNFQLNYFIKHYLYNSFNEKEPYSYFEAREWKRNDQLLKNDGRYDFMPHIWDRHLDKVVEIILECKIDVVLKAFYFILLENKNSFESELTYEKIIKILDCSYKPLSKMFSEILKNKIQNKNDFDINIMLSLMNCDNTGVHEIALNYFEATNGKFEVEDVVSFMFFTNLNQWKKLIQSNIDKFNENEIVQFFLEIFINTNRFVDYNIYNIEDLKEILEIALSKLSFVSNNEKSKLISIIANKLGSENKIPKFITEFMERILFLNSLLDIQSMLQKVEVGYSENNISNNSKIIISFLDNIKNNNIPYDVQIIEILETGGKEMIKVLIELLSSNKEKLTANFTTLLILCESNVVALNELAKSVFENLPKEEQKNLHFIIIDSPDKKTYEYGFQKLYEIYEKTGEIIPEDFLVKMLQHSSYDVKSYISNKIIEIVNNLADGNENIFMYYTKTLLFLPNKISNIKNNIYDVLPTFVDTHKDKQTEIEEMLLSIGSSNVVLDSERALVALAKIKKGVVEIESKL